MSGWMNWGGEIQRHQDYFRAHREFRIEKLYSRWHSGKESTCQCRRCRRCQFGPWVEKIPWRRKWQPTPVSLPGKFHGQRIPVGHSPWGLKESDLTEWLTLSLFIFGWGPGTLWLWPEGSVVAAHGFSCPIIWGDLSSPSRDQTYVWSNPSHCKANSQPLDCHV